MNTTGACGQCHQRWDYEEWRCDRCRLNWPADDADEEDDFAIVEMALTERAGRSAKPPFASPSSGGHLSGGDETQILVPARSVPDGVPHVLILDACKRYEAAAWFASPAEKAVAASELVAQLRVLCRRHVLASFNSQAEYERYTTLMEQAEERKS